MKQAAPSRMRLPPQAYLLIRDRYVGGETARSLARQWGVSPSTIYRHAAAGGWTRRHVGAAFARAEAARIERKSFDAAEALAADASADPGAVAAQIARSALSQVRNAVSEGRASDAKSLAALIEQMRKLATQQRGGAIPSARERRNASRAYPLLRAPDFVADRWDYIAETAACMLHNPAGAPAVFAGRIAEWRRAHLGEGDEESIARAHADAARAARFFDQNYAPPGMRVRSFPTRPGAGG